MSSKSLIPFALFVILGSCILCFSNPAHGAVLQHCNLHKLWAQAETVFLGLCTKTDADESGAIKYTFSVLRAFKGHPSSSLTVRMHKTASTLARVPTFRPGQEVILFLYPESTYGFTSPVGFGQGCFYVISGSDGRRMVLNEFNNKDLFSGMNIEHRASMPTREQKVTPAFLPADGPLDFEVFAELLGVLAADPAKNQKAKAPLE